jgi:hypothetical protein
MSAKSNMSSCPRFDSVLSHLHLAMFVCIFFFRKIKQF